MGATGAAALLLAGLTGPAYAEGGYAPVTIALSAAHLSGAVGGAGGPTVTVDIEQAGVPAGLLRLRVIASSDPAVAAVGDVRQERTRQGDRKLTVRARGQGCTELTLQVTGRGGRTATAVLSYAASARDEAAHATRHRTGSGSGTGAEDLTHPEWKKARAAWVALN
ncbi:hypothetical protein [Streptomyces sp. CB00455]|uniref:hypothetical protein n=1 Tax=Streptomyces sp. CB00455 TaxID=1703927 RepID=UPI00093CF30C|nr:hypothetical protein [Streptomyces sp. CB00455]